MPPTNGSGIDNLLFDWSGVISDDFDKIFSTYRDLFRKYGRPDMDRETFRNTFELPYANFCRRQFPGVPDLELQESFRHFFRAKTLRTRPYGFVQPVLDRLRDQGKTMVVVSSHSFVSKEMDEYYPGTHYFKRIYEDLPNKEDVIHQIVDQMRFNPRRTAFVGDMTHDVMTGKKAGLVTIAVTSGYQSREVLARTDPDHMIGDITELPSLLEHIQSACRNH